MGNFFLGGIQSRFEQLVLLYISQPLQSLIYPNEELLKMQRIDTLIVFMFNLPFRTFQSTP
jgi:hypothetical protein